MTQPWPEPDDRYLPVRLRVDVWDQSLCRADGPLRRWLDEIAGRDRYALTSAGVRGRDVYYVMLPSLLVARLLLEDWAGRLVIDGIARAANGGSAPDCEQVGDPPLLEAGSVARAR